MLFTQFHIYIGTIHNLHNTLVSPISYGAFFYLQMVIFLGL